MEWTLVTGGAKRLGAEICTTLASKGYSILVHYYESSQEAKQIVKQCRAYGVEAEAIYGDFSSIASLETFIQHCSQQFPSIQHLINNVGTYLTKKITDTSLDEWLTLFQTNLHTPFALSQAFLSSLRQHHGSILNIGVAGLIQQRADINHAAYKIAKTALWMLTKTMARTLAPEHVRVNMVSPGYLENSVDLPDNQLIPMGRPAALQELVRVIAFLLDKDSSYITGQNIEVGGGVGI